MNHDQVTYRNLTIGDINEANKLAAQLRQRPIIETEPEAAYYDSVQANLAIIKGHLAGRTAFYYKHVYPSVRISLEMLAHAAKTKH